MTITADWQVEIATRSILLGADAALGSGATSIVDISGLGALTRDQDIARQLRDGSMAGTDTLDVRVLDIDLEVRGTTAAICGASIDTLRAGWKPSASDLALDVRLPGMPETTMRLYGRTRSVSLPTLLQWNLGFLARMSVRFLATDPLMYGAASTTTTNAGNATTDRATVTIVGTGGTPKIVNANDSNGTLEWNTTLAGAATRIVDLRAKTVVDGSGTDYRSEVLNTSTWYRHVSGTNSLTVTGCTASTSLRPAYF